MSALRLVILVLVAGATCCLGFSQDPFETPDTPQYVLVAHSVVKIIQKDLEEKLAPITTDIAEIRSQMEACTSLSAVDIPAMLPPPVIDYTTKLNEIERKVEELQRTVALEEALQKNIADLNENMTTKIREASQRVEQKVFTKEEMEEAVRFEVVDLRNSCIRDHATLTTLQGNVLEVKETLEEVQGENVELMRKVDQYVGQDVPGKVREVKSSLAAVVQEVERLGIDTGNFSLTLQEVSNSLQELAATPPPPEEEEEEEKELGAVYPCMDSTFPNGAEICPIAVQFNKCRQTLPSYHCCHTCTTGGQLPEMGEWRHLNLDRNVTANQLIYFFSD